MNFELIRRQLQARGYWDKAGDDGAQGGGSGAGGDNGGEGAGDDANSDQGAGEGGEGAGDDGDSGKGGKDDKGGKTSDEVAKLLKESMSRKEKIKDLQTKLDEATRKLSEVGDLDLEEVRGLLKERKEAEQRELEAKGQWDQLKKQLLDQHQKTVSDLQKQIQEANQKAAGAQGVIEELTVGQSFSNSKFIGEEMTLTPAKARIVYGAHFEVEEGKVVAYNKPRGAADRAQLIDGQGEPLGFDEAIKALVEQDPDRDHLIRSKAKPGAGSRTIPGKEPETKVEVRGESRIAAGLKAKQKPGR